MALNHNFSIIVGFAHSQHKQNTLAPNSKVYDLRLKGEVGSMLLKYN